jgi:FkbM family methyltransferase
VHQTPKFVPLETIVDPDVLAVVDGFELDRFDQCSTVRGKSLNWLCLSKRLLWMAYGHEYIEPELLDWIDSIPPGSVLYDIGASNGIFAIYAAASNLRVVACEPDPSNYFLLAFNNYLNSKLNNVKLEACLNIALSDSLGIGHLQIAEMEIGGHQKILDKPFDVFGNEFQPEHSHSVLKTPLDQLVTLYGLPAPDYLKIDVDGAEIEVLKGSGRHLSAVKEVFIELTEELLSDFAEDFFASLNLKLVSKQQVQKYNGLWNCIFKRN